MRWLVTGASGQLGSYLLREAAAQELNVLAWSGSGTGRILGFDLQPVDLGQPDQVRSAFQAARPGVIIHAAAMASVATCRDAPECAHAVNAQGSALLARLAAETRARFVHVSTDMVFDGERGGYREQDRPSPLSVYGQSKALAEESVISFPNSLVVRISLLFGPSISGRRSYFDEQVDALRQGRPMRFFRDEWRTPLGLLTAARALLAIARSECVGYLHLGGPERLSRLEMGRGLAACLKADSATIFAIDRDSVAGAEPRPRDVSLDSSRWRSLFPREPWPDYQASLSEMGLR